MLTMTALPVFTHNPIVLHKFGTSQKSFRFLLYLNKDDHSSPGLKAMGFSGHFNNDGLRPIHIASAVGHIDIAQWLITRDANIKAQDHRGWQPIHFAASEGHTSMIEWLFLNKANIHAQTHAGETAMVLATKAGKKDSITFLNNPRTLDAYLKDEL